MIEAIHYLLNFMFGDIPAFLSSTVGTLGVSLFAVFLGYCIISFIISRFWHFGSGG